MQHLIMQARQVHAMQALQWHETPVLQTQHAEVHNIYNLEMFSCHSAAF